MTPVTRFAFAHLKSFQREDGAPYDQYVCLYSMLYCSAMRALHRSGFHWFRERGVGDRHCDWCGANAAA